MKYAKVDYTLLDIYKEYTKTVPEKIRCTKEQFFNINKKLVEKAMHKILYDSEEVKFPVIGSFRIKKFKQNYNKRLYIDHKKTKELGVKVYHTNDHREGYAYKWNWRRNKGVKNILYYSFLAARYSVRRKLPQILKNHKEIDYFM